MSLKHALLGVLHARAMTGYELKQFFDASTGWLWSAQHSQIYPLLAKMQDDGLVVGAEDMRGSRLRRVVYTITDDGLEELRTWVGTAGPVAEERDPFLLQSLFFDLVPDERFLPILRDYAHHQRELAEEFEDHSELLGRGETALIRERLSRQQEHEHARTRAIKARAFSGRAAVARARAEWALAWIEDLERQ